jgi:hypothetical protein
MIGHWTRAEVPKDVDDKKPDPTTWGTPAAFFAFGDGCPADNFKDHEIIINTTSVLSSFITIRLISP